jgi:hypothetical protein
MTDMSTDYQYASLCWRASPQMPKKALMASPFFEAACMGRAEFESVTDRTFFPFCYMAYVYVIFSLHTIFNFSVMI